MTQNREREAATDRWLMPAVGLMLGLVIGLARPAPVEEAPTGVCVHGRAT